MSHENICYDTEVLMLSKAILGVAKDYFIDKGPENVITHEGYALLVAALSNVLAGLIAQVKPNARQIAMERLIMPILNDALLPQQK